MLLRLRFLMVLSGLAGIVIFSSGARAQVVSFQGMLQDKVDQVEVPMAYLSLHTPADSALLYAVYADTAGHFYFSGVASGEYLLYINAFGYKEKYVRVDLSGSVRDFVIQVDPDIQSLEGIVIKGRIPPVEQKGDTTVYNADAFKTLPNADAEDLVKKLPGVTVRNGEVTAQGEKVTEIYVDGKPFFGQDPNTALKSLPADIIDKVEILDRGSDQAQFTGFDDGDRIKAINIVTKKDRRNGAFGRGYLGYGSDDRYNAGATLNLFNGNRRITVLGISNNINQQNFSGDDLASIADGGGRGGGGRFRPGGRGPNEALSVNQQNGITRTNALGINFTDSIGSKVNFTGSYFYNRANNTNRQYVNRNYFIAGGGDSSQVYRQQGDENSLARNHRLNMRIDYQIDSSNSLLLRPILSVQELDGGSALFSENIFSPGNVRSISSNDYTQRSRSVDFRNNALYRHSFRKKGRTLSVDLETAFSVIDGDDRLLANNEYASDARISQDSLNQRTNLRQNAYTLGTDWRYTEPVGKSGQLMLRYEVEVSNRNYDKETSDWLGADLYRLDSTLSGNYESRYLTNEGGVSYRLNLKKLSGSVGLNYQNARLTNHQALPVESSIDQSFNAILPNAMLRYSISREKNIRVFYRAGTSLPSVNQLNNIVNNSNPLLVTQGNPDLKQEYSHRIFTRIALGQSDTYKSLNIFAFVQNTFNYIGNAVMSPGADTVLSNGYTLREGARLTTPTNMNGYWMGRSSLTYSFPLDLIKSNIGLTTGYTYSRTPGLINDERNFVNNHGITESITIGSNFSRNFDFTLGYMASYNIVKSVLLPESNQNYFFHTLEFKAEYVFNNGFLLQSNIGQYLYRGLSSSFNRDFVLWNVGVGKKILKDQRGELRLSVFDILNQNNSVSRNVTENYVEDVGNSILNRYFMLTFSYNFRKFN